jgi:hypothetical protein
MVQKSSVVPFLAGFGSCLVIVGLYATVMPAAESDRAEAKAAVARKADGQSEQSRKAERKKAAAADKAAAHAKAEAEARATAHAKAAAEKATAEKATAEKAAAEKAAQLQAQQASNKSAKPDKKPATNARVFRFGLKNKTPKFDKTNWRDMATNISEMNKLMPGLMKSIVSGQQPSPAAISKMQKYNLPLAMFAIESSKEIEGTGPNGSFTHPAVIANLIQSLLDKAGDPLTGAQTSSIEGLGDNWVRELETTGQSASKEALELDQIIAEVDSKQRFIVGVRSYLTASQNALLFNSETFGRVGMDLLSPALVYISRLAIANSDTKVLIRQCLKQLLSLAGIEEPDLSEYEDIGRAWVNSSPLAQQAIGPRSQESLFPTVTIIQQSARAQSKAMKDIINRGLLSEKQEQSLREAQTLFEIKLLKAPKVEPK